MSEYGLVSMDLIIKNLFDNLMYNHTNEDSTEDLELDNDCEEIFLE